MYKQELKKIDKLVGDNVVLAKAVADIVSPIISAEMNGVYSPVQVKEVLNALYIRLEQRIEEANK